MSKFHKHCSKPIAKSKVPSKPDALLTSKPFCDCGRCTCQDCPDILKLLGITVTDTTCKFISDMKPNDYTPEQKDPSTPSEPQNLLDVISKNRYCNCDIVARGLRDDIHMNLGMTERRNEIADFLEVCDKQCTGHLSKEASSTNSNFKKPVSNSDSKSTANNEPRCTTPKEKCAPCGSVPP